MTTEGGGTRRLAGAAGIMMASIFASRVLGLVRDAIISGKFGQGSESDIYYAAFLVPDLLFFLIAGGALSSAFIPVFTEKITLGKDEEAWRLFSTVVCVMTVVVGAFILAGEVFARPLMEVVSHGFTPQQLDRAVPLTRIVLPAQICFFLGGTMMGVQQARGRFLIPSLGPNIYNLGIIVGGLLLTGTLGVSGLVWGALGGAIAGNLLLQLYGTAQQGMRFRMSFAWRDPAAMKVWKLMLPVIFGLALPQVSLIINRVFATGQPAALSAVVRANMVMQAPLAIFGQALAVAIFPTMSAHAARQNWAELRATASQGIRFILFLTIPSAVFLIVLGHPIISLLLQHGKFKGADTDLTALTLNYYAVGIFAWSALAVLARGFYAMQDTLTPIVIGTVVTLVFLPLNPVLMNQAHMGAAGLALASTIGAVMLMVAMYAVLARRLQGLDGAAIMASSVRNGLAALVAGCGCWAAQAAVSALLGPARGVGGIKIRSLLELAAGMAVGVALYAAAASVMHSDEIGTVRALLRRKLGRKS